MWASDSEGGDRAQVGVANLRVAFGEASVPLVRLVACVVDMEGACLMSKQRGARAAAKQVEADQRAGRRMRLHGVVCASKGCEEAAATHMVVGWCHTHEPKA